jgi:membrane protease subunit HflK
MAWNQPGDDKRRSSSRPTARDASLDEMLRRWQERARRLWRPGSSRGKAAAALIALALLVWLASGYYQLDSSERGVMQTFGRYVGIEQPGSGWHWPWPVQRMTKVDVASLKSFEARTTLLTSDESLLTLAWSVRYRIADPLRYLFQLRDPQDTLQQAGDVVVRRLAAHADLQSLLNGAARDRLDATAREGIQQLLDAYGAGIEVSAVNLTDVQLPDPVTAAQHAVDRAADSAQHQIGDAQSYASDLTTKAQATAQHQISDAQVYAIQTLAKAQSETQRFDQLAAAYTLQPKVLRDRLYIQAVDDILSHARKVFVDARAGNVIYVPLDKLSGAAAAGAANAPTAEPSTAPPAAVSASTPEATPGERQSDEDRSRARGER